MKRTHLSFSKQVVGEKWNYNGFMRFNKIQENSYYRNLSDEDGLITWPPKNYSCSFCHREFKSAQALGGHMNVHRRDRARLRQLPPWIFDCSNHLNPNSNSNPIYSSSASSSSSPCAAKLPAHTSFCKCSWDDNKKLMNPRFGDLAEDKNERVGQNCELAGDLKRGEVMSLDLEMGFKDPQSLDLELRLGSLN